MQSPAWTWPSEGVAHQVQHAGLHQGERPGSGDRVGQPAQPVADDDAAVLDTPVLQLGEHPEPVLRALPAVTNPQPQDVAFTGGSNPDRDVDRPVGDLPITDASPRSRR